MFIDSTTLKRVNIHAKLATPAFDSQGFQHDTPDTQEIRDLLGITEIPDPVRESDETHYNQEIDDAPYLVSTPKPEWMIAAASQAKINAANQAYLDSTDWYIVRFAETGVAVPAEITAARTAARAAIAPIPTDPDAPAPENDAPAP